MTHTKQEILFKTRRKIFGFNIGNNTSVFQGNGIDFREIKEYSFGDDVRKINWKATAKTQSPFINVFNEERELNILIAFMVSGSIYFGTKRLKQELMGEVLSILAYSTLKNGDNLSALFFSSQAEFFQPPTKKMGALDNMLDFALRLSSMGKTTDYHAFCDHLNTRVKKRSLVFMIGDFYGNPDLTEIATRHEVYAIIVRDRFEEVPVLEGNYNLLDPNTLQNSPLTLSASQLKKYAKLLRTDDETMLAHFRKHKISFTKIYTDEEPYEKLFELFRS